MPIFIISVTKLTYSYFCEIITKMERWLLAHENMQSKAWKIFVGNLLMNLAFVIVHVELLAGKNWISKSRNIIYLEYYNQSSTIYECREDIVIVNILILVSISSHFYSFLVCFWLCTLSLTLRYSISSLFLLSSNEFSRQEERIWRSQWRNPNLLALFSALNWISLHAFPYCILALILVSSCEVCIFQIKIFVSLASFFHTEWRKN